VPNSTSNHLAFKPRAFAAALFSALACLFAAACDAEPPARPRGVLLIAVDGLRPEAIETAPTLADLAERAVVFSDAVTAAPLELPALASLLTGLEPLHHGARDDGSTAVSPDARNLAEILSDEGWRARAAVSSAALAPGGGLERGFASFDAPEPSRAVFRVGFAERRGEVAVDQAITDLIELARGDAPFLVLVHLVEPRAPFTPPDVLSDAPEDERYAGEVRAVDRELARLFEHVAALELGDRLVTVVASLRAAAGERDDPGMSLAPDVMRVPLMIAAPGIAPARSDAPASLVDVAPTVLSLLGVPPGRELDGRDLFGPAVEGERVRAFESLHPLLAHGLAPRAGIARGDLWLVRGPETSMRELGRETELFREHDARSRGMLAELERRFGPPKADWPSAAAESYLPRLADAEALLAAGVTSADALGLQELANDAPNDPTVARHLSSVLLATPSPTMANLLRVEPMLERALGRRPDDAHLNELLATCAEARETLARRVLAISERKGDTASAEEAAALAEAQHERRIAALERALERAPSEGLRAELERARL